MKDPNKNRKGYKHTRAGWIPEDWDVKKIGEIVEVRSGIGFKASEYVNDGVRLLQIENVGYGYVKWDNPVLLPKEYIQDYPRLSLKENDIVLALNRPVTNDSLKIALLKKDDTPSILYQRVGKIVIISEIIESKYIFYLFKITIKNHVKSQSVGSDQPFISLKYLYKEHIPIPSLKEQRNITLILSTWDKAIETTESLIVAKEHLKKGLMQHLLTGKKRLPGFCGEWKLQKIANVSEEIVLKNRANKDFIVLSCTKYDGLVPSLEYFGRKIFSDDLSTYKIVHKNNFAYATNHIEEGSIGYQGNYEEALISPMYTVFKTDNSVNDEFLFYLLKSYNYIHEYNKRMEGSIDRRGGLRWHEFSKIKIPLISFEEQSAISTILSTIDIEINLLKLQLELYRQQKKGLMQVLLTGAVRVKK